MESQTAGRRRRPDDTPETARASLRIPRGLLGPIVTTGVQDRKEKAPRHPRRELRGAIGGIVVEARAVILRARRPERQQQVDQVQHVDGAVEVDVLRLAARIGGLPEAQQQLDEVKDVYDTVVVDVR